jgi:queuosine precursor transporter
MIHNILGNKSSRLFIILGGFFIANAIIAEMIGVKIFSLEDTLNIPRADFNLLGEEHLSYSLSVGVLPWPIVFVMTDIINEYYGVKGVRFLSFLTAILITFAFIVFFFAIRLAPNDYWLTANADKGVPNMQAAFTQIFGQGMNIILGSLTAFLLGQLVDALIFRRIKNWTGEKNIWARATMSTLVSQFIDSFVVTFIAFYLYQQWSLGRVAALSLTAYSYKFVVAIAMTPVIYLIHWLVEQYLGKMQAAEMKANALRGY